MLGMLWLIPILCLAGALINLVLGAIKAPKAAVTIVGVGSVGAATLISYVAIWQYLQGNHTEALVETYFTWISAGTISVNASLMLDPLSAVMVAFVTFVGFLIHIYSIGYMHGESDEGYARYFAYLNLFMFSMLVLVLGSNLALLFVGWEGVGLCSYLLIGFYFDKEWCATAGKKAFIVNRIGDFGFILAIFSVLAVFKTVELSELLHMVSDNQELYVGSATLIALLLFVGAVGKSAQIPLYVWLPDAMAGPTPVSALIHAATMVTAGVYMVARCNFFFQLSPTAMLVVAIVGGVTALFAATIALVQNDIKKVLAYSTVSQLGYMFLAAGTGAYIVAIFHVVTHAFFKACLFLGSGSVIHACGGEQDMRKMGGLRKYMPKTYWTFWLATVAIAGIPPLAGFVSKDAILAKAFEAGYTDLNHFGTVYFTLWFLALSAAFMTAFYMFRLVYMTFEGSFRGGEEREQHLHESPWTMTVPLLVLAFLSVFGGAIIGFPGQLFHMKNTSLIDAFLAPVIMNSGSHGGHALSYNIEIFLVFLSIAVAASGILLARKWYRLDPEFSVPKALAERFSSVHRILLAKYRVDEFYGLTIIRPLYNLCIFMWKVVDVVIIDGIIVNGLAFITELTGDLLRFLQTGNVRNYALSVALGVLALAVILW